MGIRSDLISATMLLTRLPVRGRPTPEAARAAWAWPLVGAAIGLCAGAGAMVAGAAGLPDFVAGIVAITVQVVLTGALHEDGLADMADGFWGGFDRDRRLAIMRDSRIGSYGVIALVLSLAARGALVATLLPVAIPAMAAAGAISRAAMAAQMRITPPARSGGLGHDAGRPTTGVAALAGTVALAVAVPMGWAGLVAILVAAATTLGVRHLALAKIGGQTGDVLGATQQAVEIAALLALAAITAT